MIRKRLTKEYERDFSLILEEPWAQGLITGARAYFGKEEMPDPFIVFFVTKENLQIWEHREALDWYMDQLLAESRKGPAFVNAIMREYKEALEPVMACWKEGPTGDKEKLRAYMAHNRKAIELLSLWYYSALDERTPEDVRAIALELRNHDDYFASNGTYLKGCVQLLGGRRDLANVIYADEFPDLPNEAELLRRTDGVISVDGKKRVVTGLESFAKENPEYEFVDLLHTVSGVSEVKGQVAYRGKVRGPVRILKNEAHMKNVKEGDVLVSPMTTPDFLPAMKLAAAFVTDEGGITCHAGIVARELKTPCIIGTKIATKVFKDGDMVEVDANAGIVRKIESSV